MTGVEFLHSSERVDLSACDKEPIHIPGSIQPHGVLLAVAPDTFEIQQLSRNAAPLLNCSLDAACNQAIGKVLTVGGEELENRLRGITEGDTPIHLGAIDLGSQTYSGLAHRSGVSLIVELEPALADATGSLDNLYPMMRGFLDGAQSITRVSDLNTRAAQYVRSLTGFDRVLIYQFDADWNGIVVAEDRNEMLPAYLDLRFPASDIPAQARALYQSNRLRLIPDADYEPVPIWPTLNPKTGRPLDLSHSILRSVSPVHIEYMHNMGTPASMSISILIDGRLWGLISCHHHVPKAVPMHVRTACDFIGQMLAMQLAGRLRSEEALQRIGYQAIQNDLLAAMASEPVFIDGLKKQPEALLRLLDASGAAIVINSTLSTVGVCPDEADIQRIIGWLDTHPDGHTVAATDALSEVCPPAVRFAQTASGALAISISQLNASYILWFRPEVIQTVTWGGKPSDKIQDGSDPTRLHPRKSFERWKEIVRHRSLPWSSVQLDVARAFRDTIVGIVLRKAEELAALNQELTRSNKELESFSYSVSHDLRAPFRHIVGYAEMLKDKYGSQLDAKASRYIDVIVESAGSAGKLVDDLLGFSQMGRMTVVPIRVDMNRLVQEVRDMFAGDVKDRSIEWSIPPLHPVLGDPGMMRQVMQNLISNAIKYTRTRPSAHIRIETRETDAETVVTVKDNGIGFDMAYVDKLFGVFQRLHRVEDYEGTGIGLANVRRIVERHGGRTWAEGELNTGAAFHFAIPKQEARQ